VPPTRFEIKTADDRRNNLRQMLPCTTVTIEPSGGDSFIAELVDVSRSGIRFRASAEVLCGTQLVVKPPPSYDLRPIRARIVRQRLIETPTGDLYECGARYTEEAEVRRHSWWIALREAA
jgi:hypothetical protein